MNRFLSMAMCIITLLLAGCGYGFQGRHNPLKELGVEKIYVAQFRNSTYRPGIEQLFSTAMIREIKKYRSFELVNSEDQADAVLAGDVVAADATISSTKSVIPTTGKAVDVATEYNSGVVCTIVLTDRRKRQIFNQSVSSNKIYPGASSIGEPSATNSLVNESEQRLAIQFLASEMMSSIYQRMVDIF